MKLVYGVKDKPKFAQLLIFAFQQLLAIMAATIAVPAIVGNGMSAAAALFGAGVGTIIYQMFTKFRSPVVIGPTVALIGLSLAGAAVNDVFSYGEKTTFGISSYFIMNSATWASLICALVTLLVVVITSTYGKKMIKLIPFIIGILAGYLAGVIFTLCGIPVIDFSVFQNLKIVSVPEFTFLEALKGVKDINGAYIATVAVAYVPVAFVVFAEHIADHKNLSSIIGEDLLENPGLHRTLLGDGIGSAVGAFFGGCPNTTYGESVGCVAITRNASVITITTAAIMCIIISFFGPFVAFLDSIPGCVMGGVCVTLYGFIAVSGLKMIQKVDLNQNKNLFVVASILIPGIGGMALAIGKVTITAIACALILGIIVNLALSKAKEE